MRKLVIVLTTIFVSTGVAKAGDCSQHYNTLAAEAARCGHADTCNIGRLQQLEQMYSACLSGGRRHYQATPTYQVPEVVPRVETEHDRSVLRAFGRLEKRLGNWLSSQGRDLYAGESLSSAKESEEKLRGNIDLPPGFTDPFEKSSSQSARKDRAGRDPFTGEPHWNARRLQPPAGYTDPFKDKPSSAPGSIQRYSNCTFDSPSCL